jgi:hypothetical protein
VKKASKSRNDSISSPETLLRVRAHQSEVEAIQKNKNGLQAHLIAYLLYRFSLDGDPSVTVTVTFSGGSFMVHNYAVRPE